MPDAEQFKRWRVTETLLRRAHGLIPLLSTSTSGEIEKQLKHFDESLQHSEFELALDALQEIGEQIFCPGGFWRDLERAALIMKLTDRARYFREKFLCSRPTNHTPEVSSKIPAKGIRD